MSENNAISKVVPYSDNLLELRRHGKPYYPLGMYENNITQLPEHKIDWHWHNELELSVVVEGSAIFHADKKSILLKKGEALFCNHNVLHAVTQNQEEECKFYSIVFSPTLLFDFNRTELVEKYYIPMTSRSDLKYVHLQSKSGDNSSTDVLCMSLLNKVVDYNLNTPCCYELMTKSALYEFWSLLYKKYISDVSTPDEEVSSSPNELRISQGIAFIEANYRNNITLDEIAQAMHISKSECCRCFKRTTQVSPIDYLIRFRILEAARKIISSHADSYVIADLAESVGISSISYFSKLFKQYMGQTPTEYRKLVQERREEAELLKAELLKKSSY